MVRRGRWSNPPWIGGLASSRQGDALGDFGTRCNKLSVYLVNSEDEIQQVVTGLAAARKSLSNLDYTIIEVDLLRKLNLSTIQIPGKTPHRGANDLHHDIVNLTADNILALIQSVALCDVKRCPAPEVKTLLESSIEDGDILKEKLEGSLSSKLK